MFPEHQAHVRPVWEAGGIYLQTWVAFRVSEMVEQDHVPGTERVQAVSVIREWLLSWDLKDA